MPVMGRFRLRRESRRAFLHFGLRSGFAIRGPVHSFAENLTTLTQHCVCETSIRRRPFGPPLNVLNLT